MTYVIEVSRTRLPSTPPEAVLVHRCAYGFLVRDNVPITCTDWRQYDENCKNEIWKKLKAKIKFPKGTEQLAKKATLKNMGIIFRHWKVDLNAKYVKKNEVPSKLGKITRAQWDEFVHQKTKPNTLALSEVNSGCAKKNIYPHHLGFSRYASKVPELKKKNRGNFQCRQT